MPEHFGIKDMWVVIKKNFNLIFISAFLISVIFSFFTYKQLKSMGGVYEEGRRLYVSTVSCYVKPNMQNSKSEVSDSKYYRDIPDDYIAMMGTDACINYVYKGLLNKYSEKYLEENSEYVSCANEEELSAQSVKNLYKIDRNEKTMVFNIYAISYNKDLSKSILDLCIEYLKKGVLSKMIDSELEISDEAFEIIKSKKELEKDPENKALNSSSSKFKDILKIVIKRAFIPVFGLMFILIFILMLKAFFNPTLNRKSDFSEYEVPILGEIKK